MLNTAVRNTNKLIRQKSQSEGIRIGNRFTKKATARLMASIPAYSRRDCVYLLDPGAGTGILTAAAAEELARAGVSEIHADLYETDADMLPTLENNMRRVRRKCHHDYGVRFRFRILSEDFLTAYADDGKDKPHYDYVFMNPDDEQEDKDADAVGLYRTAFSIPVSRAFYFLDAALRALKDGGHLVAVVPTLFATADSCEKLRAHLFSGYAVPRVHLFSAKDKIRDIDGSRRDELKKHMLLYCVKSAPLTEIAYSDSYDDGEAVTMLPVFPRSFAVRGDKCRMLLLQSEKEYAAIRALESLPETLTTLGLRMRTGLVIPSRYTELLYNEPTDDTIPLLSPRGIRNGHIDFPLAEENQYIKPRIPSLAQDNKNMLLLKRVPAKADGRHLYAAVYLASQLPYTQKISTENKLIYVDYADGRELDAPLLHGLYALVNSTPYECYCSILSKSAQVNAGEYKNLPFPDAEAIRKIGRTMMTSRQYTARICDILARTALRLPTEEQPAQEKTGLNDSSEAEKFAVLS